MSPSSLMRLSQGQLNTFALCPRKFQQIYLEQLGAPTPLEQQERLAWGNRFHLLMQQHSLGLPIDPLVQADPQLHACLQALQAAAPDLFSPESIADSQQFRQSEHRRTLEFQGYVLTVIYDLVVLDAQEAQIFDWKTYPRPQDAQRLAQDWQTLLYLFVLAETSPYPPEQISMTYWFVRSPAQKPETAEANVSPQSLCFTYNTAWHEQTRQQLSSLLESLTQELQNYEAGHDFSQISIAAGQCQPCSFNLRCQRQKPDPSTGNMPELWDWNAIQEVAI